MNKVVHEAATLAAAGVVALRKAGSSKRRPVSGRDAEHRWRIVTVNCAPEEVKRDGHLPSPLAALGDRVETSVRPAPPGKGTELAARWHESHATEQTPAPNGQDPDDEIRSALRQAKQLLEVGEVLSVDGQPAGKRSPTPTGKLVEAMAKRAGGEGLV